jgi:hypothetical protein
MDRRGLAVAAAEQEGEPIRVPGLSLTALWIEDQHCLGPARLLPTNTGPVWHRGRPQRTAETVGPQRRQSDVESPAEAEASDGPIALLRGNSNAEARI